MLKVDKKCTTKTTNTSMWSANLGVATRAIHCWNMEISEYKQQKEKSIMSQEFIAGKVMDNTKTVQEAQQQQVAAWKYHRTMLKKHDGERLKDLQTKVQDS